MEIALIVLLVLYSLQSLAKFAVWALVPYETRISRIASYYAKEHRVISTYDTVTLVMMAALVVLLFLTDMHYLSFITGLTVGMLTIQVFFHRFIRVLPEERMPQTPTPPVKLVSYAIQAQPGLAWREIAFMTVLSVWALYMLIGRGLLGLA
jgi:hypothetical protein